MLEEMIAEISLDFSRTQIETGVAYLSPQVEEALRNTPREQFVPRGQRGYAFQNRALPIGEQQTISQPFIVALMTQLLDLTASQKVLEIGTGSGYQAAVLSELAGEVYTVEVIEKLKQQAECRFNELAITNIFCKTGDGYLGWLEKAPFDAIMVTAAIESVPKPLIQQLKPNGRMILPIGKSDSVQFLVLINKQGDGRLLQKNILPVRFVPFTRKSFDA